MKKRLEALAKIGRLHKQMHDLAVWRLAALGREREGLVEDHRQMLAAMESGLLAYGATAAPAFRRIRALETKIAAAEIELAAQQRRALAQGARAKLADRARENLEALYRDQKERKELAELIDASLRNPKSSPA
jgi:capsule polysaccharide export protein KpsE/RkpR